MLHVALSNIKTYARRYIAVILAVAIGTAFLAATLSVNSSTQATLKNSLGDAYKNADLVAYPDWDLVPGAEELTELGLKDIADVRNLPEVSTAYGLAYADGLLRTADNSYGVSAQPVDPDQGLGGMELIEGRAPQGSNEIIIDASHAEEMGVSIGDVVALENGAISPANYNIVGIQRSTTNPRTSAYALAGMSEKAWQHFSGGQALITEIVVNGDGSDDSLKAELEKLFAGKKMADMAVMTADEKVLNEVAQFTGGTDQLSVILLVFALIALVVTGLVVVNTFAVVIAQRTRELALLRILGAKRKQIRSSVLIEALLIGILASILGVLLAVALMAGLIQLLHVMVPEMSYAALALTPQGLAIPILVGVLMTVVAASLPARRAMKLAPLAALRPFDAASVKNRAGKARIIFGSLFVVAGASLLAYGAIQGDLVVAFLGGLVSFPGILMLASLFVPSSVSGIGKAVAGKSTAGKLAALNAVRNPGRTTATATALLIGVTLVSMIMVGGQTAKASLNNAVAAEFPVDMMVSFYDRQVSGAETKNMLEQINGVDGITASSSFTSGYADVDMGTDEMFNAEIMSIDPTSFADVALDPNIVPADGEIVYVLGSPENPTMEVGGQTLAVRNSEAMLSGNIVTEQTFSKLEIDEVNQYSGILIKVDSDVNAAGVNELVTKVSAITGVESSMINGGVVMKSMFSQIIDVLLMIVSALLAVAVLIALIGVANTLSLSILERTRENSLLRALGLKKKQLRGMLATEAVLIGGVAALLGLVLGVAYGLLGARSALASMGTMTYEIPWWQLALVLLISIVAALLASVTPGRRAAKLSPVEGLAVE